MSDDIEELRRLLEYDPLTGTLTRLVSTAPRAMKGMRAGGQCKRSHYRRVHVFGKQRAEHDVIWFYMTGLWPVQDIDHKNNIRDDNRWENLREVSRQYNLQNQKKPRSNNTTGFLGVNKARHKYNASIKVDGRKLHLGNYDTPEEAYEVYLKKKKEVHLGYVS